MSQIVSKSPNLVTLQDIVHKRTNISKNIINCISEEGLLKMYKLLDQKIHLDDDFVNNLINESIKKTREMKKINAEINEGKFTEEIVHQGGNLIYYKFVNVNDKIFLIESKSFNSERQCVMWLRLKKIKIPIY